MNSLIFDAGPIISLTTNNLLWILPLLKKKFSGKFILPVGVKQELIDRPLATRRFKLEAIYVQSLLEKGVFSLLDDAQVYSKAQELLKRANTLLSAHGQFIQIVQLGEMQTLAAALIYKADAVVLDELITRTLVENPLVLHKIMEKRLHTSLKINKQVMSLSFYPLPSPLPARESELQHPIS